MEKALKIVALLCILTHANTLLTMYSPTPEIFYYYHCPIAKQSIIQAQVDLKSEFPTNVPYIVTVVKQLKSKKFYAQVSKSKIALYIGYREKGDGIIKGFRPIDPKNVKTQAYIKKEYVPYIKKLVALINKTKIFTKSKK